MAFGLGDSGSGYSPSFFVLGPTWDLLNSFFLFPLLPSVVHFSFRFVMRTGFLLPHGNVNAIYVACDMLGMTRCLTAAVKLGGFQGFASAAALNGAAVSEVVGKVAPVCSSSATLSAPAPVVELHKQCRSNAPSLWGGLGCAPFVERYSFAFTHVRESSSSSTVDAYKVGESTNIKWHEGSVSREAREQSMGQKGCVLWFTGLSGSGKSTVAYTLEHALHGMGKKVYVMDGDNIRHGLNSNLGFSAADREENIRRIGEVAKLFADMGVITLVSFISPYRNDRDLVRSRMARDTDFVEVFMKIPIEICETRDPKGLYKAARAGKIKGFTGIDDPYEEPLNAEIVVEAKKEASDELEAPEAMASTILDYLSTKGYLSA